MEKKLTSQDKNELKKLVNVTDDPDTLTSFIMSKTNEDFEDDNMSNYWDDATQDAVEPQDIINFIKSNRDINDYNEMIDIVCTQFNIDSDDARDWLDVAGYEGVSNKDDEVHESFHLQESEDDEGNHDDLYDMLIDKYVGQTVMFEVGDIEKESPEDREFMLNHNGQLATITDLNFLATQDSIGTDEEFLDQYWDIQFTDNEELYGISGYELELSDSRKKVQVENITEDLIVTDNDEVLKLHDILKEKLPDMTRFYAWDDYECISLKAKISLKSYDGPLDELDQYITDYTQKFTKLIYDSVDRVIDIHHVSGSDHPYIIFYVYLPVDFSVLHHSNKMEVESLDEDVIYMDKEQLKDRYGTDDFDLVNAGNEDTIVETGKEEEEEPVNKIEVESLNEDIGDPVDVKIWYSIKCTSGYYDDRKVCFGNAVKNHKVSVLVVAGGFVQGGSQVRFLDPDSAKAFAIMYIPNSGYDISDYAITKSKATDTLYEVDTNYGTAYMTGRKLHELTSKGKEVLPERKRIEVD